MNEAYGVFLDLAFLFAFGSILGYGVEVLFRRLFSCHRWTNPGYLYGPFLPLYGFGVVAMYLFSSLPINTGYQWLDSTIVILIIGVAMTLIEYIAGLIFIKGLGVKLWDYSNLKGNIQGIICPLFSAIWLVVGALYYFLLHHFVVMAADFFANHTIYIEFWLGFVYGFLIFDIIASSNAFVKLSKAAKKNKIVVSYEEYKLSKANKKKERKEAFLKENPGFEDFIKASKERSNELIGRLIYKDESAKSIKTKKKETEKNYSFDKLKEAQGVRPQDLNRDDKNK